MISPIKVENSEDGVFLVQPKDVNVYFDYYHPTVLKYDKNTTTMGRSSYNFGGCKGMTFDRALVFPNKPLEDYIQNNTKLKAPEKYYVGVTRPRLSLAIVIDSFPSAQNQPFFQKIALPVGAASIEVMRYVFDTQEA
jgi:hypothetical protein